MARKTNRKLIIDGKADIEAEKAVETVETPTINKPIQTQTNGGKRNVRSIDELLGRKHNPYSVGTIAEYEAQLKKMPLSDLERHATEMGSLPNSNRNTLITRLLDKYRKVSSAYYNTNQINYIQPKNPEKLAELLNRVRQ